MSAAVSNSNEEEDEDRVPLNWGAIKNKENFPSWECFGFWASFVPPSHWYSETRTCKICHITFQFSAREKKLWYESWGIPVRVKPKHCPRCRKLVRLKCQYNSLISFAAAAAGGRNRNNNCWNDKLRIIDIVTELQRHDSILPVPNKWIQNKELFQHQLAKQQQQQQRKEVRLVDNDKDDVDDDDDGMKNRFRNQSWCVDDDGFRKLVEEWIPKYGHHVESLHLHRHAFRKKYYKRTIQEFHDLFASIHEHMRNLRSLRVTNFFVDQGGYSCADGTFVYSSEILEQMAMRLFAERKSSNDTQSSTIRLQPALDHLVYENNRSSNKSNTTMNHLQSIDLESTAETTSSEHYISSPYFLPSYMEVVMALTTNFPHLREISLRHISGFPSTIIETLLSSSSIESLRLIVSHDQIQELMESLIQALSIESSDDVNSDEQQEQQHQNQQPPSSSSSSSSPSLSKMKLVTTSSLKHLQLLLPSVRTTDDYYTSSFALDLVKLIKGSILEDLTVKIKAPPPSLLSLSVISQSLSSSWNKNKQLSSLKRLDISSYGDGVVAPGPRTIEEKHELLQVLRYENFTLCSLRLFDWYKMSSLSSWTSPPRSEKDQEPLTQESYNGEDHHQCLRQEEQPPERVWKDKMDYYLTLNRYGRGQIFGHTFQHRHQEDDVAIERRSDDSSGARKKDHHDDDHDDDVVDTNDTLFGDGGRGASADTKTDDEHFHQEQGYEDDRHVSTTMIMDYSNKKEWINLLLLSSPPNHQEGSTRSSDYAATDNINWLYYVFRMNPTIFEKRR